MSGIRGGCLDTSRRWETREEDYHGASGYKQKRKQKTIDLLNIVYHQGDKSKGRKFDNGFLVTSWIPKRDKKLS